MITDNGIEYDCISEKREIVPCGESVTTQYLKGDVVVRQDITINVAKGFLLGGEPGKVG